jgi:hypothetical protein
LTLLVSLPKGFINPSMFQIIYMLFMVIWILTYHHTELVKLLCYTCRSCWTCGDLCIEPQLTVGIFNLEHLQRREQNDISWKNNAVHKDP